MKKTVKKYAQLLIIIMTAIIMAGCSVPFMGNSGDDDLGLDIETNKGNEDIPKPVGKEANLPVPPNNADAKKQQENTEGTISLSGTSATIDIDSEGRTTPFVPYRERNLSYNSLNFGDLPLPPMMGTMDEAINNLISAKVTGILYDPNSPSAIINVLDEDYLVRPGDEIEGFKISSISKDYVAIRTGSNTYRAKVGDIVDGEVYGSGIPNLGRKFAGRYHPAREEDVMVFATKKNGSDTKTDTTKGFNDLSLPPVPEIKGKNININLKTQAGDIPLPLGTNPTDTKNAN